jgi:predicted PolB exonuclease-like 3'-5' exonuclease
MAAGDSANGYLVFDAESVPDGRLLASAKYAEEGLSPEAAVARARQEALDQSAGATNFVPVSWCIPVAVGAARVGRDFAMVDMLAFDEPHWRPAEMARLFWDEFREVRPTLVTFNGRSFDLPLMELAAFRWGLPAAEYFADHNGPRNRFSERHVDLQEFTNNYGAVRTAGGLNTLAKLLGKPGKMEMDGSKVYEAWAAGRIADIQGYCLCDVLDTYFVFLRTRVMVGKLTLSRERELVDRARGLAAERADRYPLLRTYLSRCGDWSGRVVPAAHNLPRPRQNGGAVSVDHVHASFMIPGSERT